MFKDIKQSKIFNFFKRINYILVLAWAIPAAVLLAILYLNFLPFGYSKTLTIDVGGKNDDKGEFYLEKSSALGSRQELDGETFRFLDGLAYAVYEPKVVLNNATIEAEVEGDGVSFILPPDLSQIDWDYNWNYKNILNDFKVETSEKRVFEVSQNSLSAVIPSLRGISINPISNQAECLAETFCYENGFALELQYEAGRYAQLLNGDLNLYQNQKELVLLYGGQKLRYPLPDYYLGENRTVIIAFDGENLYLATDKNEDAVGTGHRPVLRLDAEISSLRVSKTSSVTSWKFHSFLPELLETKDSGFYLDGSTRLVMPDTADDFENGPFTVFAEWTPEVATSGQQIIGHYNWEIWQNDKSVSFQVGRMSTSTGPFYKISYAIDETFFNQSHTLLAVYSPVSNCVIPAEAGIHSLQQKGNSVSEGEMECNTSSASASVINGYIELFVDGIFAGREYFANETIWPEYGSQDLTIGWTPHNYSSYPNFQGNISTIKIARESFSDQLKNEQTFIPGGDIIKFPIYGAGDLNKVKIGIRK